MADAATLEKLKNLSTEETFRVKSKAMALTLLDVCYNDVTSTNEPAPFAQKLEMLKTTAKFADLEPRQNQIPQVGFSIRVVYSGDSKHPAGATFSVDGEVIDELDAPPAYFLPSAVTEILASLTPAQDRQPTAGTTDV